MTLKIFLFGLVLYPVVLCAQSQSIAPEKRKAIVQLLDVSGSDANAAQAINMMLSSFQKSLPAVQAETWAEIRKEMKVEELMELIVPVYDRHFSLEEIKQMVALYRSPIGRKIVEKTPLVMQESAEIGRGWGEAAGERVRQRLAQQDTSRVK